ncbi:MAG: 1-phosphofructokinase, partial [Eubacterium sp.]|nr:1-phosphofructokinase [Eubacterium sp.]
MIVTVTMNPAIDKTVDIERLEYGGLNRISHVEMDAGGKGINVSKTIHELGGESIVTGFIAGNTGKIIQNVMDEWQIKSDFVEVEGETRTNTKVYESTGSLTELNEPGPEIKEADLQQLLKKLEGYAKEDTLFVLAGSVP